MRQRKPDPGKLLSAEKISVATLNRWRKKYGMMEVADANRLKALEKENAEFKRAYANAMPETKPSPRV